MKWYKHFSDALDDPFIQELMDEFKHMGYTAWFGLLEIISKENGNNLTGKIDIKPKYLKRKLRISISKLDKIFNFCATFHEQKCNKSITKPKLLFNKSKDKWNFEVPKLLELKDNYTKDLQATSKKPSNHKEVEEEVEEEVEKKKKSKEIINKPENVNDQIWNDWVSHRKSKKAKVTKTVISGFTSQAEKAGISLEDAFKESIERNWVGFKADWYLKDNKQGAVSNIMEFDPTLITHN